MGKFKLYGVDLKLAENLSRHRTDGFISSKELVVRRGAAFKVGLELKGRPFNPNTDILKIKIMLGRLYTIMPVSYRPKHSDSLWTAFMDLSSFNPQQPCVYISPPASAPVGRYKLVICAFTKDGQSVCTLGKLTLLCNPWCKEDSVYIPFEDQREEYVLNDSGLLFTGTATNLVPRPWSFDQFESGVLEACLNLLEVSPQHQLNRRTDYLNRNDPVYLSRVVSAMINSEDDRGVVKGNWTGDFKDGLNPSLWTGSGDILRQWAQSGFSPVKYGQCWVFAAVMCTVMRVLGVPCRVVTNYNSAHDTNSNLVIEEYYTKTGQKLPGSKDSIWNFHVWVECWMSRPDLGSAMDGWQVLDPTPQERSGGVFCCGPAPVKAVRDRRIGLIYDVPFVYAEVNADVHTIIVSQGQVVRVNKDTEKVGALICTKAVGFPRVQNITGDYKVVRSPTSTLSSRSSRISDDSTLRRASTAPTGILVFLNLDKPAVSGEPIRFTIKIINKQNKVKRLKMHLNAQAKEYNHTPSDTFWESHGVLQMGPAEVKTVQQQILPTQYEDVVGDDLINLAVVLEDMSSQEQALATEEFNIASPQLIIKIANENSVMVHREQMATVTFTNPFSHPVSGILVVVGAGLIQDKVTFRMPPLKAGGKVQQAISFIPRMVGSKMLHANLMLTDVRSTVRGFKMVSVKSG
ncbi:transglutaminase 5, like isoform X2 [Periophthalmus magnuspinnatus]|uniref:transglutaminase 5, like isoform X2 n=1 Tax=Periophthalmus magnuspinnatus TaxID=409849 RepID=UPI002436CCF9|nr:transglutaminase 5, like isoform X2 [Periophthalmus magnuspinnatus]